MLLMGKIAVCTWRFIIANSDRDFWKIQNSCHGKECFEKEDFFPYIMRGIFVRVLV